MGLKLSKLVKRSYVVSEGVQTDLSIEACEETFDSKSFTTPPRDVQHLCDPRSISKGITRTPIMCKMHNAFSPAHATPPKPYLETNLDDVLLPYHPPNPCDHLMEIETAKSANGMYTELNEESSSSAYILSSKSEESLISQTCNVQITENYNSAHCSLSYTSDNDTLNINNIKEFKVDLMTTEESSVFEPFVKVIEMGRPLNCPIHIDCSETVQKVCQQILDELLESKDDIYDQELNEPDEDLFPDDRSSESESSSHEHIDKFSKNCITPTHIHSELVAKPIQKVASNNVDGQFRNSSPLKRRPFGEVGNIQQTRSPFGSTKLHAEVNNSPLKSMLPLLPSLSTALPSKLHRSKWDTENTLLI